MGTAGEEIGFGELCCGAIGCEVVATGFCCVGAGAGTGFEAAGVGIVGSGVGRV